MEEMKGLIRKRGGIKRSLTNCQNYLIELEENGVNEIIVKEIQERLKRLEHVFDDFCDCQTRIEEICEEKDVEQQFEERDNFERNYFSTCAKAKTLIGDFEKGVKLNQSIGDNNGPVGISVTSQVKLPTLQLPKFSGNFESWIEYRDTFNSVINTNANLTDIQKLHYLRSSLQGQASYVIRALELSETNYQVAWKLLCERYDNKKMLVNNHIRALFNLPIVRNESGIELRRLLDDLTKHLMALEALKQPVKQWGMLVIHMVVNKLDNQTRKEWEANRIHDGEEFPAIEDLKLFLRGRCELLENLNFQNPKRFYVNNKLSNTGQVTSLNSHLNENNKSCLFCDSKNHLVYTCEEFLKLNPQDRTNTLKTKKMCLNCLKINHFSSQCKSGGCRKCGKKHHFLLHYDGTVRGQQGITQDRTEEGTGSAEVATTASLHTIAKNLSVLLSTAKVKVKDCKGQYHVCRVLLDSGSESNFITTEFINKLGLEKEKVNISVMGINKFESHLKYRTEVQIYSIHTLFQVKIPCLVINKITGNLPSKSLENKQFNIPKNIKLADDQFNESKGIDLLLGANIFWDLLEKEKIKLGKDQPILHKTVLGWILAGPLSEVNENKTVRCNLARDSDLNEQLKKFWELEEIKYKKYPSPEEKYCEQYFQDTTKVDAEGRFIVKIPFKIPIQKLGDSFKIALKRFYSLERKLEKNSTLKEQYVKFMREYVELGHMSKILNPNQEREGSCYLPHHGVVKEDSVTTKLRVVFDGSCKTTNNISLNEIQYTGPRIQQDLFNILLRFRTQAVVLVADIEKMYRQVLVAPECRNYQRILWRENREDNLKHFTLNTVSYGTASAPYLAIRALQQAAKIWEHKYPESSKAIINDMYVDDLLTGSDCVTTAIERYKEISCMLESSGFRLRKWMSNNKTILNEINLKERDLTQRESLKEKKVLGLIWSPERDSLKYNFEDIKLQKVSTKRELLSTISKLFDPLGLLGPCIMLVKLLIQKIWQASLDWDTIVPKNIMEIWNKFQSELRALENINIPRYVLIDERSFIEIHAFSDASEVAFGSCIYMRSIGKDGNITVKLLCAKSRVAPIKKITIPKLELCGALLSARSVNIVKESLTNIKIDGIYYWCDSTIVLSWLVMPLNNLKPFVACRIAEIQEITDINSWRYINTRDNPADLISRGVLPTKLQNSIWWKGPAWLSHPVQNWPRQTSPTYKGLLPEVKTTSLISRDIEKESFPFLYSSSITKIERIVAYCLRFVNNLKIDRNSRVGGDLNQVEIHNALLKLVKLSQRQSFAEEVRTLEGNGGKLKKNLLYLNPFLDSEGLVRVGGRLENSNFAYNKKHPLLLSGKHPLSKLLMGREHVRLLHAGPLLLLSSMREKFWPTNGKNLAKRVVKSCLKCCRVDPIKLTQLMGNLPSSRSTPMYPFFTTGVDYAGPLAIRARKGRGKCTFKCYICLFICFTTKAIHLEPVTDLTTEAFIATLRRFVARRGLPTRIYSDNGRNFVGAASKLKELGKFLLGNHKSLVKQCEKENINWSFIPANSPHFGGLWEAGVKATKFHLKRILGNSLISFEELLTVLTQIEAVLNSRPIHALSSSPNDCEPLTPAHFLMGRRATAVPDPNLLDIPVNRLTRYKYSQRLVQLFWKHWSKVYISELQCRQKWHTKCQEIKCGDLVLIKDNNLPPLKWKLGRVFKVHTGVDNITRVVSIKTRQGIVDRAISRICPLPIND